MKIVQITPGTGGGYYCDNCLRDAALVRALRRAGQDVLTVPLYLPLSTGQQQDGPQSPVFFGGINVYLQQKLAIFRRTPRWLDRIFDTKPLLRWAARKASMTSASDQAQTILSMLRGENGRQAKELERLVGFLADRRPDVVCLSNALLIGLARRIKAELHVPILCLLQDEDGFLDALDEPLRGQAWAELANRTPDVDRFIAVSRYYAGVISRRLNLPPQHIVHSGIETESYQPAARPPDPPAIGFLSTICPTKGFDTLVEAFVDLKQKEAFRSLRLRAGGDVPRAHKRFLQEINARLAAAGLADDVQYDDDANGQGRLGFLQSLSVLSVPTRKPEAFGLSILESLACGVPVVVPDHGAFPELIEATGGGLLFRPNDAGDLARALAELLVDTEHRRSLGRCGRESVVRDFDVDSVAGKIVQICDSVIRETKA